MDMTDRQSLEVSHHCHNLSPMLLLRITFSCDGYLSFKLANDLKSDHGQNKGNREKAFIWSERVKSTSSVVDTVSLDVLKMVCGICRRPLRRKPYCLENVLSSSELSVVAVLVCGHVYHADCLEKRTCDEDKQNPPCPLCLGLLSSVCDSGGRQESPPTHRLVQ